ncbi:MAG TPA: peptide chain release factor N(5)-glutamine methyltransferase [Thermoanaerobaculia bacterium]|jgi:release factor glutamine methyltransferase|nr:peptide chain release factor N(5)-glutamine methyltransferase [Thermoanaerobaculia bacterium]
MSSQASTAARASSGRALGELLREGRRRLGATAFAPPREAALLLGAVLGLTEAQAMARDDQAVPPAAAARFEALLARRLAGEPVAYLLGSKEFYGRRFAVDARVLIPRPETEHVVEAALALALPPAPRILDVGTGSGCLAVTLALELPGAFVAAADVSPGTLAVAAGNARRHGVADRVAAVASDLTAAFDLGAFDLVVSNPPYVDPGEASGLSPEVCNFEPHLALFSPGSGDSTLARLFRECARPRTGVPLVVEIGAGQLDAATRHAGAAGLEIAAVRHDYAGVPRVLVLRRS